MRRFIVGLDLGQAHDFSAFAVVEPYAPDGRPRFDCVALRRFPLKTPYPVIVAKVKGILEVPPLRGADLVVDQTGVGRAVIDELERAGLTGSLYSVTITGGDTVNREGFTRRVPKKDLVSALSVSLQTGRLRIAAELPFADVLRGELLAFRAKISAEGRETFGAWREGTHDDLVLALALAVWHGGDSYVPLIGPQEDRWPSNFTIHDLLTRI